ncbi:hypothetical protein QP027_02070 [Corynebacterium breve]|uniref:PE domain-containing protein n=1 Tax=Corynebacterium breve TaxID=3049799 RepID=A0ABY8VJ31_9CORY|nr:hypothetical protein [Corynebacterium breve]WIM68209.1 hypothetical protein QP027_02070 [Corynebacterium breve]
MNTSELHVDPDRIALLVQHMHEDAELIPRSPDALVPAVGPLTRLSAALHNAHRHFNDYASTLASEAHRLATDMSTMSDLVVDADQELALELEKVVP